jgi:tetratricopeptide (TPR) repeat protein
MNTKRKTKKPTRPLAKETIPNGQALQRQLIVFACEPLFTDSMPHYWEQLTAAFPDVQLVFLSKKIREENPYGALSYSAWLHQEKSDAPPTIYCLLTEPIPVSALAEWLRGIGRDDVQYAGVYAGETFPQKQKWAARAILGYPFRRLLAGCFAWIGDLPQGFLQNIPPSPSALQYWTYAQANGLAFEETPISLPHAAEKTSLPLAACIKHRVAGSYQTYAGDVLRAFRRKIPLNVLLREGNSAFYRTVFFLLVVASFLFLPLLSFDYGMTWDEPVLVEYAEDILAYYQSWGKDKTVFDMTRHARNATMHYGASFDFLALLIHRTISPWDMYDTRHVLNALTAAMALLMIGRLGRLLFSWRVGVVAILLTLLTPMFFGHAMNNPKDIPFLMGYAVALYYMAKYFREFPRPMPGTILWLTAGMAWMISIKIGGLIVLAYFGLFTGLHALYTWYKSAFRNLWQQVPKYTGYTLGIILVSYFLGILFWPWGIEKPFENPLISLNEFSNFRFLIAYELFEGKRINMDSPPYYYTVKWMAITLPLAVLAGFVAALVPNRLWWKPRYGFLLAMLVFTLAFPIVYTVIKNSTLYSSWRHLFFVYVPFAVLTAWGWEMMFQKGSSLVKWGVWPVAVLMCVLLARPVYWMVSNHPHQYIYFNELVGGINGAYKNYETEYWGNAMRVATEWLVANIDLPEEGKIRVAANFEINTAQHYFNRHTDKVQMIWTRENEKYKQDWDYAFFGTRGMPRELIEESFPPKGTIHLIKADTVPLLAIVKRENKDLVEAYQLRDQNNITGALEKVRSALAYDPQNIEAQRLYGMLLVNLNQYSEAIQVLVKCIKINPDDFASFTLIGVAFYNQQEYKKAISFFDKSVELKVNNTSGYLNRGRSYMALQDYQSALKDFEQAAYYDGGKNARIYYEASLAMIQQGLQVPAMKQARFEQAARSLQTAMDIQPNFPDAIRNMAYILQELGDQESAKKYLEKLQQFSR